jgi:hypothetical protein
MTLQNFVALHDSNVEQPRECVCVPGMTCFGGRQSRWHMELTFFILPSPARRTSACDGRGAFKAKLHQHTALAIVFPVHAYIIARSAGTGCRCTICVANSEHCFPANTDTVELVWLTGGEHACMFDSEFIYTDGRNFNYSITQGGGRPGRWSTTCGAPGTWDARSCPAAPRQA